MTLDLFSDPPAQAPASHQLGPQSWLFRARLRDEAHDWLNAVTALTAQAPFRRMTVPGGKLMSVGLSNCGAYGWVSDLRGYRYEAINPENQTPWPAMPESWQQRAAEWAREAGFDGFEPDACLINEYQLGAKMGLHQDKDERDFSQPIVSVSLGMSAVFQFGGLRRTDPIQKVVLAHGDVVVWGGVDRLRYHGIATVRGAPHPLTGERRINLTFRRAQAADRR